MKTTLTVAEAAQIVRFVEKVREYEKTQRTSYTVRFIEKTREYEKMQKTPCNVFRDIEREVHEAEEAFFDAIPTMEWIK